MSHCAPILLGRRHLTTTDPIQQKVGNRSNRSSAEPVNGQEATEKKKIIVTKTLNRLF